ncbi:MAG: hypothetical protein ACI30X_02300 [Muribaculaceae bacterium]
MIKVGLSAAVPDLVNTVKFLKSHPDVELQWIYNNGNSARVAALYPELTGEVDDTFVLEPDFDTIDLYIGPWSDDIAADESLKVIFTTCPPASQEGIAIGVPEYSRKALVRGALGAYIPSTSTLIGALALMPLAKNLMLNSAITGSAILPVADRRRANAAVGILPDKEFAELKEHVLSHLQTSFVSNIDVCAFTSADSVAMATFTIATPLELSDIASLYHTFYDDHHHVVLLEDPSTPVCAAMVRGTNKAVISLAPAADAIEVSVAFDDTVKRGSGLTGHLLNLLFGLDELTGF